MAEGRSQRLGDTPGDIPQYKQYLLNACGLSKARTALCYAMLSHFSRVRFCVTPQTVAYQAPPSWDSPGKNTGVGCHFLLQCMKVKSESEVA